MRTTIVTGLIVRTDQGKVYLLEQLRPGIDPKVRVNNILTTLKERGPFLECKDGFGGFHYVNSEHVSEIYLGEYDLKEADQ